ncbi:uncharacterized protein LOC141910314 [Tubulanus polymorphus]|uniref:uncharacterized protein LOC141910314 n=1 Tax=Tubulanus polymorphus TaxID=672921 RepID=UPI003DA1E5AB
MAVLPVRLLSLDNGVEITTNAFLDTGAGASFITDALAKKMGLRGQATTLDVSTMLQTRSKIEARKIRNLEVRGLAGGNWVKLHELYTHPTVAINWKEIPTVKDVSKYHQLRNVDLKFVDAPVGLLLGANVPEAIRPIEMIPTEREGPYAMRTAIGWTLLGPVHRGQSAYRSTSVNKMSIVDLNKNINAHFSREFNDGPLGEEIQISPEEKRFMQTIEAVTNYTGDRYEVGIPLKRPLPPIPNSRWMAERRLIGVIKRMNRTEKFSEEYHEQMKELKKKGYTERVPNEEIAIREKWYLPHHGVSNQNRNSKLRIVFDGSAQQNGISLNDLLMKGPKLTNRLDGVLIRFREYPVAVSSNIQGMFHQIQVAPKDRNWYRLLWIDELGNTEEWRWTVHPFGSRPSPAIACHVLRRGLVEQSRHEDKEICKAATQAFYVDDNLNSWTDAQSAQKEVTVVHETSDCCGFPLRKYASTRPEVLDDIPEDRKAVTGSDINVGKEDSSELPTLGMKPQTDKLTYRAPDLKTVKTRR